MTDHPMTRYIPIGDVELPLPPPCARWHNKEKANEPDRPRTLP